MVDIQFLNISLTQWLSTILTGIIGYTIVNLLYQRRKLPPGPFPLPFLGNLLSLRGNIPALEVIQNYRKTYGNVVTIWFGNKPHILVSDWDLFKDMLITKRDDFSGRPGSIITDIVLRGAHDIVVTDKSRSQMVLKKTAFSAVRKYIITRNFVESIQDNAKKLISRLADQKEPFDPSPFIYKVLINITEKMVFGDREKNYDNVIFREAIQQFEENAGNGLPSDYVPFLRPFFLGRERAITKYMDFCLDRIKVQINEHECNYNKDDEKDFIDAVIGSRNESDDNELSVVSDENLIMIILNVFLAGVGTTHQVLTWLILYLANDIELQNRIYNEIKDIIGDRLPIPEDKDNCPLISATISETMRIRTPLPLGLPHKTTCETTIGKYRIPTGISILFNFDQIHKNENHWENSDSFMTERFLDNEGKYTSVGITDYAPFGLGKRSCIGEKMARTNIFMITVSILQKFEIRLQNGPGSAELKPIDRVLFTTVKPYEIVVKQRG